VTHPEQEKDDDQPERDTEKPEQNQRHCLSSYAACRSRDR
jgi:hypothetical protein